VGSGLGRWARGFEKVPLVAVEIFEDGDGAKGLFARSFKEADAAGLVGFVIAPEIVGVEKEEDAASGLIAEVRDCSGVAASASSRAALREFAGETRIQRLLSGSGISWSRSKPSFWV
jgi:hypothetical protein